jgi:hypothetical protein
MVDEGGWIGEKAELKADFAAQRMCSPVLTNRSISDNNFRFRTGLGFDKTS